MDKCDLCLWNQGSGGGGGGGSSTLAGLTDVDISNPTDGQTLVYNATAQKWVNGESASGGGVLICHADMTNPEVVLDKTYREIVNADMAILKMSEDGINTLAYLATYNDLPNATSSSWEGYLDFANISGPVPGGGGVLPVTTFAASDPDEYPVLLNQ